jgi:hypothetical protein
MRLGEKKESEEAGEELDSSLACEHPHIRTSAKDS